MAEWQIRRLGPGDADLVLEADVFDGPATAEGTARVLGRPGAEDPRSILIVAEAAGRVVGFASGMVLDHPDKSPSLFIHEVGVNPEARRRGIGRALVFALRAEGQRRGCTVSWVLTDAENAAARAMYAGSGGVETTGVVMVEWDEPGP